MANDFTPKLGRIGWKAGTRLDRYINRVMHAAHAAGHVNGASRSKFTGARMGRGSAFGTLAGAGLYAGGQRRAIVKARITKLKRGDLGAARAHLRYIQRDGVTPEGEPGRLRDECLNEHLFSSYMHAQHIIETWRNDYNHNRPHSSLNGLTPIEFANRSNLDQNLNKANL